MFDLSILDTINAKRFDEMLIFQDCPQSLYYGISGN
jgi:hypothetical protein